MLILDTYMYVQFEEKSILNKIKQGVFWKGHYPAFDGQDSKHTRVYLKGL